jgi:glutamate mutase epsilon subunit
MLERWKTTKGMNADRELDATMAGSTTQEAKRLHDAAQVEKARQLTQPPKPDENLDTMLKRIQDRVNRLEQVVQGELLKEELDAETRLQSENNKPQYQNRSSSGQTSQTSGSDSTKRG